MTSETIYLYKKTHNKTGLKYLGKTTSEDPHKYQGSGTRWLNHIKKHGYDVTTEIIKECHSEEELIECGLYYSELWNIVEDPSWANLKEEAGDGGKLSEASKRKISEAHKGKTLSEETKHKMSKAKKGDNNPWYGKTGENNPFYGKTHSEEARQKLSKAKKGENNPFYGKTLSDEQKQKISKAMKGKTLSDETKHKMSEVKKGIRWITNGTETKKISGTDPLPEGYWYGNNRTYGTRWITNGVEAKMIPKTDPLPEGFRCGRK